MSWEASIMDRADCLSQANPPEGQDARKETMAHRYFGFRPLQAFRHSQLNQADERDLASIKPMIYMHFQTCSDLWDRE